jgi:hypothetical protein
LIWFVSLDEGRFHIYCKDGRKNDGKWFDPDDIEGMKAFCKKMEIDHVCGLSSVDFPEENGLDEDFNANEVIGKVLWSGPALLHLQEGLVSLYRAYHSGQLTEDEANRLEKAGDEIKAIYDEAEPRLNPGGNPE